MNESTTHRIIQSVEDTLIESGHFTLPGKKQLHASEHELEVLGVDVAETPVERPKKQQQFYSGKKKRHTLKAQVLVNQATAAIVCTAYTKGRVHDFRLFKHSRLALNAKLQVSADKGYQGIRKLHPNSQTQEKTERSNFV